MTPTQTNLIACLPSSKEFAEKVQICIHNTLQNSRPFFIILVNIANLESFEKRRSGLEALSLMRDIGMAVRNVVHPSQFVGFFQSGLGLVFDAVDPGNLDKIAQRLAIVIQNAIRASHCNDFQGRWSDIIFQFLHPNDPGIVYPKVGWAIYPRDGEDINKLIARAQFIIAQP